MFYSSKMIEDHRYKLSKLKNIIPNNQKEELHLVENSILLIKLSKLICRIYLFLEICYFFYNIRRINSNSKVNTKLQKIGIKSILLYTRLNILWYITLNVTNYFVNINSKKLYSKYLVNNVDNSQKETFQFKQFIKHNE